MKDISSPLAFPFPENDTCTGSLFIVGCNILASVFFCFDRPLTQSLSLNLDVSWDKTNLYPSSSSLLALQRSSPFELEFVVSWVLGGDRIIGKEEFLLRRKCFETLLWNFEAKVFVSLFFVFFFFTF